jgi:hypothetical protein
MAIKMSSDKSAFIVRERFGVIINVPEKLPGHKQEIAARGIVSKFTGSGRYFKSFYKRGDLT